MGQHTAVISVPKPLEERYLFLLIVIVGLAEIGFKIFKGIFLKMTSMY